MSPSAMKLGLGTAQFGMNYGISNEGGQTSLGEVSKIIKVAGEMGISLLDTAPLYGSSEEVLGKVLGEKHPFRIVTKTPKFEKERPISDKAHRLIETFEESLKKLGQSSLYGLLVHDASDFRKEGAKTLFEAMESLKLKGKVKKIGFSLYSPDDVEGVLERWSVDFIQVPLNVFDQRLIKRGLLKELKKRGVEIHVRSVFLQGLLLMEPHALSPYFDGIKEHFKSYRREVERADLSALKAALSFVRSIEEIDIFLCGVNNLTHLKEVGAGLEGEIPLLDWSSFSLEDESVLNPSQWKI